jgi:intracellular septation protein
MEILLDLFPVLLFFITFKLFGIQAATAATIAATIAVVATLLALRRKVKPALWISLGIVTVFGGATLALDDPYFIKLKLTVLDWLFAAILIVAQVAFRKNLMRVLMEPQISLPEHVWFRLNLAWIVFFLLMGGANFYVMQHYSDDGWANFKIGAYFVMLAFALLQGVALFKYLDKENAE